ncbi:aminopeptidase P family protein [candidate division FCPU426 bacterium]|nr:aminopeptidase P family protein [candidate division FCPU426 bacterium]
MPHYLKTRPGTAKAGQHFAKRLQALQQQARAHAWDALWVVQAANRRYTTGFSGSTGWVLIPAHGKPLLLIDGRYQEQARQESPHVSQVVYSQDPFVCLGAYLRRRRLRILGFEDEQVSVGSWKRLQKQVAGLRGKSASGCIEAMRMCKDFVECRHIKKAVFIAEKAFACVLPTLKPGRREIEVAVQLENAMISAGGQGAAFPTIVASGPNASMPHAKPTQRRFRAGDLVVLDFGCIYKGYHSDLTRTIGIARMTNKQREMYKLVKKAQVFAQKELFSGRFASEADEKAREIFKKDKMDQYFVHSLGHGIGLEIHEAPKLSQVSKERLEKGMVVTCEPGLYFPKWGGLRIEDDVLVEAGKAIWLSRSPGEIPIIGRK